MFNADQNSGLPAQCYPASGLAMAAPAARVGHAEAFVAHIGANIRLGGQRAFYTPKLDYIRMGDRETFLGLEAFYASRAPELGHWTGHPSRLNCQTITRRHGE